MAKFTRRIMGGAVEFQDDDTPLEMRSFNALGKSPLSWQLLSRSLHWSAVRLMEDPADQAADTSLDMRAMYRPAAAMLGAYAIETLLKMVIVDRFLRKNGMKYDASKTKDFLKDTHHRLDALSQEAGLRTNKDDRNLLRVLSSYSVWGGRYPIPLSVKDYSMAGLFDPDLERHCKGYVPLYGKLDKLARHKLGAVTDDSDKAVVTSAPP